MPTPTTKNLPVTDVDPILSVPYCAKASDVSVSTYKRAAKRGEVQILQISPRRQGVRQSEHIRFINSRRAR